MSSTASSSVSARLVCLGNPLLDIQATVSDEYLARYQLKANDAVLLDATTEEPRMTIFDELLQFPDVKFIAGGAAQNTARGAAYVLGAGQVAYFGSVGQDKFSAQLQAENDAAGVVSYYQQQPQVGTGKCAALITGHNRSLVTDLGAANHFTPDHLDRHWDVVEKAELFYVGGFHLTVSPEAIVKLGQHAQKTGKPFVLNLSAPFIPQFFKAALEQVLPYTTYVIANESEAAAFAEAFGLTCQADDLAAVAQHIVGDSKTRTVIFTHGLEPTVVVTPQGSQTYAVKPLASDKIVDTNGAGDAFAAGFVAGLAQGEKLDRAVDMGQWLAALSIQQVGASYPSEKLAYA
ncbi:LAME_0F03664g1_1 [Lachancea meyersii CBS 8951]|uniref:Adenosine kinase n=1 Tax=Lachancea meyersii CBS 8951 TaxID=1266667 RepID=A0A1G4JRF3_9SACH|nr:LAME_0F03664g1_1 [Lachancea meyersii CBS 8951]